ncbi:phage antirepressor KilAC domain-containing protein [Paraburkholderia sp. EG304]|uniref:phage antirepressor KilAC domain-containing protein n=1 Tax=Paraburkholderia sp. EG304 TaxID=3237015 RepID=UPI003977F986
MNQISCVSSPTMSSREIAELVEKRHDNVKRTVETLAERGVIELPQFEEVKNHLGQGVTEYRIGKRDSYVIVAQLSPEFTARLVDRWQELEAKVAAPTFNVPSTLSGALRLAAEQAEQIEQQAAQIAAQKPAVEFVGRYVEADGSKGFREVCKLLGAKETEFRAFLPDADIVYKLGGRLVPYQPHIDAGRFEIKAGVTQDEYAYAFNQTRFTPKGVEWIAGKWMAHKLNGATAA